MDQNARIEKQAKAIYEAAARHGHDDAWVAREIEEETAYIKWADEHLKESEDAT